MSHINGNEKPTETSYTPVEMNNRAGARSSESGFGDAIKRHWSENGKVKLVMIALGIFCSYFVVGLLQEKIMRSKYTIGDDVEKFEFENVLIGMQFIFAFIVMKVLDATKPVDEDKTHYAYYALAAAANVTAMFTGYYALRFVSYPMQVVFKSAKPISVMFCGLFICKRYTIQRYIFVVIIVIGVIMFKFFEKKEGNKPADSKPMMQQEEFIGISLLIGSLLLDGILGAIQDKIRDLFRPNSRQFMIAMSAWGSVYLVTFALVNGDLNKFYSFAQRHPHVLLYIGLYAVAGVVGQLFIFTMISCFGSLACSVTTTVRKFFSVVGSIIIFQNPSTPLQWLGAALVFSALLADAVFGKKHSTPRNETVETDAENIECLVNNPPTHITIVKSVQQESV